MWGCSSGSYSFHHSERRAATNEQRKDHGHPALRGNDAEVGPELRDQGGHSGQPPQGIRLRRRADQLSLGGSSGGQSESGEPGAAGRAEEALGQRRGELQIRELLLLILS
jgi:hypothetical protein